MATEKRPRRSIPGPSTSKIQKPPIAASKAPSSKSNVVRPAGSSSIRPNAPERSRKTTSILRASGSTKLRVYGPGTAHLAPKRAMLPWVVLGAGGAILTVLVIILAVVSMGEDKAPPPPAARTVETKTPVDVSDLVRKGERQCEEGLELIRSCDDLMRRNDLSPSERAMLKEKLQRGVQLISAGMNAFDKAREKAGENVADAKREYSMARKQANAKLAELGR